MNSSEPQQLVIALVGDILGRQVDVESSMENTPEWDSLKHMQVIFAFEDALGTRLAEEEMSALRSVRALIDRAKKA